jgi:hypothetical protein
MPELGMLGKFLADAHVDAAVFALRPDYRAMLLAVDGLVPDQAIKRATRCSRPRRTQPATRSATGAVEQLPHVAKDLRAHLARLGPDVRVVHRPIAADMTPAEGA